MKRKELLAFIKGERDLTDVLYNNHSIEGIYTKLLHYDTNQIVYDEENPSSSIYYVVSGEVVVTLNKDIIVIPEKEYFGIENIEDSTNTSKAISAKPSIILELGLEENKNKIIPTIDHSISKSSNIIKKNVVQFQEELLKRNMDENFSTDHHEEILIVFVNLVKATLKEAKLFLEFLTNLIDNNEFKIVVDLRMCKLIDSTFLGALVKSHKHIKSINGEIVLVYNTQEASTLFMVTYMDKVFKAFTNMDEAIKHFEN